MQPHIQPVMQPLKGFTVVTLERANISVALMRRQQTGEGQRIDVALLLQTEGSL